MVLCHDFGHHGVIHNLKVVNKITIDIKGYNTAQ